MIGRRQGKRANGALNTDSRFATPVRSMLGVMSTDCVLTINEYYDGLRLGPHIYEAEFDHSTDEYGDTYSCRQSSQSF